MMTARLLVLAVLLAFTVTAQAIGPTTRANDDSCDIALLPAATLLLPYFEVDFTNGANQSTLFTVTNVAAVSRVARVTLWTDFSYPVLTFNVYLTGYDTQSISLFDVLAYGIIGSASGTGTSTSHVGGFSDPNTQLDETSCAELPGRIEPSFVARMQEAFTLGTAGTCDRVGHEHEYAVGYATIDVVGNCSDANPTDPEYFTNDIRFDNVLIGDYQQVSGRLQYAQVSPMVHIRAIPEGGTPTSRLADPETFGNRFANTFYSRFQPVSMNADARQPLPSRFAVRWTQGGAGELETLLKIWRQSATGRNTGCAVIETNGFLPIADSVTFDADENAEAMTIPQCDPVPCSYPYSVLPSTTRVSVASEEVFPQGPIRDSASGWVYLNLDDANPVNGAQQSWVVISMHAGGLSGDMDGTALGNGCSPAIGPAEENENGSVVIGPAADGQP
jgi:hypothetical protein